MLSSYLRKSDNASTATLAGNITASTNTTLTSLASLNTVGTITSGTISLTTDMATSGTLKAGAVTYPNTHGTSGQVLTSGGSGAAPTWTTSTATATAVSDTANSSTGYFQIPMEESSKEHSYMSDEVIFASYRHTHIFM
jgi:hypothetical protein